MSFESRNKLAGSLNLETQKLHIKKTETASRYFFKLCEYCLCMKRIIVKFSGAKVEPLTFELHYLIVCYALSNPPK